MAITMIPTGFAINTAFKAICATFHALEAMATTLDTAACASVARRMAFNPPITAITPVLNCDRLMIASPVLARNSM